MRFLFVAFFVLALAAVTLRPLQASEPVLTQQSGTVIAIDIPNDILNVNTRLGPKALVITNDTLVFLNGRGSNLQAIQVGDRVDVEYRFDTQALSNVEIVREASRRGKVVSATTNSLVYQVKDTGRINFTTDTLTRANVAGLRVEDFRALAGINGNAVYQPGTGNLLLLRFAGDGQVLFGRVVSVDAANSQIVVAARKSFTFTLVQFGTVRLNGETSTLSALAAGDRVQVAFVRRAGVLQAVALHAKR